MMRYRRRWRLPLRVRIALWSGGWLLFCCVCLLVSTLVAGIGNSPGEGLRRSLVGLAFVATMGAAGAYWLAGVALRPLRTVSETAQRITARTLDVRLAHDGPADEVKVLADALDAMLDRLDGAFAQQHRFVADAAHELRTPLATLRVHIELAADERTGAEEHRQTFRTLERTVRRLERLVTDLLLLTDDEERVTVEPVFLAPLVEEVFALLQPLAAQHAVRLALAGDADAMVCGNADLLTRLLLNLVENGIRYNRAEGCVTICLAANTEEIALTIADTGVGIPPDEHERIFDRFYRVDQSRSRRNGGVGLGLAIAASIVQRHGGTIRVESSPAGSTFHVSLPRTDAAC